MKTRSKEYGTCNMIGRQAEWYRKKKGIKQKDFISRMQTMGCDINPTSYSKLEGQIRIATDKEVYAIAHILQIEIGVLFEKATDDEETEEHDETLLPRI